MGARDSLIPISVGSHSTHNQGDDAIWYTILYSYLLFSYSGHHSVSKNFLFTLGLGVTFGFSFAYMLLSATGAGRKEIFLGPPYKPDTQDSDPHDHKVGTLNIWITECQNDWMSEWLDVKMTECQRTCSPGSWQSRKIRQSCVSTFVWQVWSC